MPNRWSIAATLVLWFVMMGLLVQREVVPRWRSAGAPSYAVDDVERLVSEGPSYWRVYRDGRPVGRAKLWWERSARGAVSHAVVVLWESPLGTLFGRDRTRQRLTIRSESYVDEHGKLTRFQTALYVGSPVPMATLEGVRRDRRLDVVAKVDRFEQRMSFFYDDSAFWSPGLVPLDRMRGLKVGQSWVWKVMDPIRGSPGLVRCRVLAEREVPWRGQVVRAYVIEQDYSGLKTQALVAQDGTILRQQIPFGWASYTVVRVQRSGRYQRMFWMHDANSGH